MSGPRPSRSGRLPLYPGPGGTIGGSQVDIGTGDLNDVDDSTPPDIGDVLIWDGTHWVPGPIPSSTDDAYNLNTLGASETVDVAAHGFAQYGVLDAACAITLSGFVNGQLGVLYLDLIEDSGGGNGVTWMNVDFGSGDDQPDLAGDTATSFMIWSYTGDSGIRGAIIGGSGTGAAAMTVRDEGSTLTAAPTSIDFVGPGVTATAAGDDVTVTIPGGATASDAGAWVPVMDGLGNVVTDSGTGAAIMTFVTF